MDGNQEILKYILSLNLKRLRTLHSLSLKELADATGLSPSYLNEIEKGKKYPKIDKLIPIAEKFGIEITQLISPNIDPSFSFLLDFLKSKFFQEFPFENFGLTKLDFFELMSTNPEKFSSLLMAVTGMAKSFELEIEDFQKVALRSYQERNKNFFPDIEESAEQFLKNADFKEVTLENFEKILKDKFSCDIDFNLLTNHPNLKEVRSVFKKGKKNLLLINKNLHSTQKLFVLGKELGYFVLGLERKEEANSDFSYIINEFKARYFSGCILIPRVSLIKDLRLLFKENKFPARDFIKLLKKYNTNTEVLLNRITQILSGHFNFENLFFLRLQSTKDSQNKERKLKINKELHFSKIHFAHGIGLPEHYCRRWITVSILEELEKSKVEKNIPLIRAQRSIMANNGEKYFCVSIARKSSLKKESNALSCITLGIPMDKSSEKKIKFLSDPDVSEKLVGRTCERCEVSDCRERVYPPTIIQEIKKKDLKKRALESLFT